MKVIIDLNIRWEHYYVHNIFQLQSNTKNKSNIRFYCSNTHRIPIPSIKMQ